MLMLLIMISMQPNPHDSLSTSLEIMCPCVTAFTEKPSTPHRSRSSHDQIMKPINHNKNSHSADVSVTVYILVENVFPQHMDYAVVTILFLFGFIIIGFCLFQVAGVLDNLVDENKALQGETV